VILSVLGLGVAGVAYAAVAVSGHESRSRTDPGVQAADAPITVTAPTRTFSVTTRASTDPAPAGGIQQTRWSGMTIATGAVGRADVESVAVPSAGERAGVRAGDEIVSIAGHPVSGSTSLAHTLRGLHAGERLTIRVARGAVTHRLHLSLGAASTPPP
jgi:S1-C subfamily serine protease